jgi:cyclopropane-fatty-acyl-phospholipid synthase
MPLPLQVTSRKLVEHVLGRAGVHVGGSRPWDLQVHDERFFLRVLTQGSLGLGESYMEGWWDCTQIDELVARLLGGAADKSLFDWRKKLLMASAWVSNAQTVGRSNQVAEVHYDLGNAFFEKMLGPSMNYSCGYWREADTLDAAQFAKMDLICRKLQLQPGERLLDIGCGWGGLVRYAAEKYGAECVGVTISQEQAGYATAHTQGLPVKIVHGDYRDEALTRLGPFDKVVSVGMFEHVGQKNYREYMRLARRRLKEDGLFLLHTIGNDHSPTDAWLNRYIFPNGVLPSTVDLTRAAHGLFIQEDWHNFRADYDKTIMAWYRNFEQHAASPGVELPGRFLRMWRYYLQVMAGAFRARSRNQLWQVVYSVRGAAGGYRSLR